MLAMSSLHQIFAQLSPTATDNSKTHTLLNGALTLFKRKRSHQWQCRFKLANGNWHTASTGTDDLASAKVQSIAIYEATRAKTDAGLAILRKTFRQVALAEIGNMARMMENQTGKRTYRDYTFAINKYLIPFFGAKEIETITVDDLADFESWREAEMGKMPMASTKRNHASAYIRVINYGRESGAVGLNRAVPILNSKGTKSTPRPAFTNEEIEQLRAYFPTWLSSSYTDHTAEMRRLCIAYVEFLLATGIRHGTEALPLRWRHIQWHWMDSKRYVRIWVSGKTGPRYLIARHEVVEVLERLLVWQGLPYKNLTEIIDAKLDKPVFKRPNGDTLSHMPNIFRNLMKRSGLLEDGAGQTRTLYSLRHTYATQSLSRGVDIHTLAKQMGTSVGMIERHYSKMTATMAADKLA
jgi:integrase